MLATRCTQPSGGFSLNLRIVPAHKTLSHPAPGTHIHADDISIVQALLAQIHGWRQVKNSQSRERIAIAASADNPTSTIPMH